MNKQAAMTKKIKKIVFFKLLRLWSGLVSCDFLTHPKTPQIPQDGSVTGCMIGIIHWSQDNDKWQVKMEGEIDLNHEREMNQSTRKAKKKKGGSHRFGIGRWRRRRGRRWPSWRARSRWPSGRPPAAAEASRRGEPPTGSKSPARRSSSSDTSLPPPPSLLTLSLFACLCPLSLYKPEEARTRTRVRRTQQQKQSWRVDQPVLWLVSGSGIFTSCQTKKKKERKWVQWIQFSISLTPHHNTHFFQPPKPRSIDPPNSQEEQDAGKTTQESLYQESSSAAAAGGGGGGSKKRLAVRIGDRRRRRWRGGVFIKDSVTLGSRQHASTRCGRWRRQASPPPLMAMPSD